MLKKMLPKNVKIVEKFKIFICISLVVILAGLAFIIFKGMNIGVDFAGGAKIEIYMDAGEADSAVVDKITQIVEDNDCKLSGSVQSSVADGEVTYSVTLRYYHEHDLTTEAEEEEFFDFIQTDLSATLAEELGIEAESIKPYIAGATASNALIRSAAIALSVAIVVMLIYIVIRFTLASALAAVCALVHDVLVMIALTAIFAIPVNSTFIAAVITIVGYSINATIIIFDRIREERKSVSNEALTDMEIANKSIAATLGRTILTTLTTLVMVIALAVFSVSAIQEFIIPIIFGLIAGTFSSVFLAAGFWTMFRKLGNKIANKKAQKKSYAGNQAK